MGLTKEEDRSGVNESRKITCPLIYSSEVSPTLHISRNPRKSKSKKRSKRKKLGKERKEDENELKRSLATTRIKRGTGRRIQRPRDLP